MGGEVDRGEVSAWQKGKGTGMGMVGTKGLVKGCQGLSSVVKGWF